MAEKVFVPRRECGVASGDCFVVGRCLANCTPRLSNKDANQELATALRLLRELTKFTVNSQCVTKYIAGSSIDLVVKEARDMMARIK